MAIYDISGLKKTLHEHTSHGGDRVNAQASVCPPLPSQEKKSFLSSFLSRLFFGALLIFDIAWGMYAFILFIFAVLASYLSMGRLKRCVKLQKKSWLSCKRSAACAIALLAALFSPAFGIMIACTYFLMYDRDGIEEIVPASLQDQFREFFR